MAEISKNKVLKPGVEILTITEYIDKYHEGLTIQGVGSAMDSGKIDFVRMSKDRMVVMTDHTREYVPNENKRRKAKMQL